MKFRFAIIAVGFALVGAADTPQLTALSIIESGQWVLRSTVAGVPPRTICVGDPRLLLQMQHPAAMCSRFVIANDPRQAKVHYNCAAAGYGWTTVRVESPRLIHIDSQGIANKAPFDWSLEGRRVGLCPATARR
jgi:hypothetical protein